MQLPPRLYRYNNIILIIIYLFIKKRYTTNKRLKSKKVIS